MKRINKRETVKVIGYMSAGLAVTALALAILVMTTQPSHADPNSNPSTPSGLSAKELSPPVVSGAILFACKPIPNERDYVCTIRFKDSLRDPASQVLPSTPKTKSEI